jgi:hypothetical protein
VVALTDARQRIEVVVENLQNPSVDDVLAMVGTDLNIPLGEAREFIATVLDEDSPESEQDSNSRTRDRVRRSRYNPDPDRLNRWADADFATPDPGVYPPSLVEREQWMGHVAKKPFAPWADRDHPEADPDEDARWKWGLEENFVDGPTVAIAEDDPRLDGRAFLQQPDDPFVYIDGDDVRDPESGDVHPAFVALLEHLGLTYADISQSGTGVHAIYRGDLPDGVKQASWQLDGDPWGSNDDLPSIEIYPGKRVCVMTGEHVPGTPVEVQKWNDDVLEPLLEANDEVATSAREDPSTDRDDYDLDDYDPGATTSSETTDEIRDVFAALDRLDARRVAEKTIVHRWNKDASTSEGYRAFAPSWGPSANGTANIVNDRIWQDTGDRGGYGGPVVMALVDAGEMPPENASPRRTTGELWFRGIEHLRDLGFDIPEYDPTPRVSSETGDGSGGGQERFDPVVECPPPADDGDDLDVEEVREALRTDGYDAFLDHPGPVVWAHDPGAGKTTTAHLAAADRDRSVGYLFDKHRKAHEHRADDVTPAVDLHVRGADQPREDRCARVKYETGACPDHGDPSNCPRMCSLYELPPDHPDRQTFHALAAELGPVTAHVILEPHDGDDCPWLKTLQEVQDVKSLVGVHEYQRLKTIRDGRDTLIDESPATLADDRHLDVTDLQQIAAELESWSGKTATAETLRRFGQFVREVSDAVVDGERELEALDPPTPVWDHYQTYDDAAGHYMEYVEPEEDWQRVEALVQAKRGYVDRLLRRIHDGEWDGTPLCIDAIFAAAAAAGLNEDAVRDAAGRQTQLSHCPRCGADLDHRQGRRLCEACDWDENDDFYSAGESDPARIRSWIDHREDTLVTRRLPKPSDLPSEPLVLDATATPEKIAAFYGVDQDDVLVHGRQHLALENLHLTQIVDGQYHHSTLVDAVDEDRATADRIQRHLDQVGKLHDRPLVVGRREVRDLFDLPDNAAFVHFHGARGLNFEECDAVVVIGAPHPRMDDLERTAELLAQGRDDLRVGGGEHSPRPDCSNPPVYRKLRYKDDQGRGRAVATKHYTGLVGALFREQRKNEIEQLVHRIRPVIADQTKHAYLITNVPTDLPVDEVCTLEELTEPAKAMFPVADGAVELAETLADVENGEGVDGFRAGAFVESVDGEVQFRVQEVHRLARASGQDVTERTVRRWIDQLEDIGLADAGEYKHRQGVAFSTDGSTLTRALSVLCSNAGVEVALKRRLATLAQEAGSPTDWLRVAKGVVDVAGDRCLRGELDPPPDSPG